MLKEIALKSAIQYDSEDDKFRNFVIESPFSICFKVTQRCNFSCKHCIASSSMSANIGLSTQECKKIIDNVKASGTQRIDITGGEPYLRRDINELLLYCVNVGLETIVTTNGSFLNDSNIDFLVKNGIFVQISIDGRKDINDSLRGKGSFDIAVGAVRKLLSAKAKLRINYTVQKHNKDCLSSTVAFLSSLGVRDLYVIFACSQGRANNNDAVLLDATDIAHVKNQIKALKLKYPDFNFKVLDFDLFSRSCILIETNGDLVSQSWAQNDCCTVGNLLHEKLSDLWKHSGKFDHAKHLLQYLRHPLVMDI